MPSAKLITAEYIEITVNAPLPVMDLGETSSRIHRLLVNDCPRDYHIVSAFDQRITLRLTESLSDPESARILLSVYDSPSLWDSLCRSSMDADFDLHELMVPYEPWYTFDRSLAEDSTAIFRNQGTKSKLWVLGNASSGCPAANPKYTAEYVIQYCTEGINKITGRSDFLTLAAARSGLTVVVVGDGVSVYEVPEYRYLYDPADAATRVTIPGTRECPLIVTTARDVMRQKSTNNNTFEMIYDFAKLFWELGVKDGSPLFALSVYDDKDTYNYTKHVEEAYEHAKAANLWPGTRMMENVEEYFAYGTMVWYLALEESADGSWQPEHFPVNTRCEMLEYDPMLHGALVEIYGEFEYFSGYREQHTVNTDGMLTVDFPWYKHNQVDNFDITGKPYAPLYVTECNLISANQIELIFNREVRDLDALRDSSAWLIRWTNAAGSVREFNGRALNCQMYQWKTLTLQIPDVKLYTGFIGSDVTGFTSGEMLRSKDPSSVDYKPWFTEEAYERSLDATVVSPHIYEKIRMLRGASEGEEILVPSDEDGMVPLRIAPTFTVTANPGAIDKGTYVNFSEPETIPEHLQGGIDGRITVTYLGHTCDWADNELMHEPMQVHFRPWLNQVMRSHKTGVYVYGDPFVKRSSMELTCEYWDMFLSNKHNHFGQRIADGLVYAGGGAEIMSYHHHAYQMSGQRNTYDEQNHFYLYVEGFGGGICQTSEANVVRNYTFTRYDNEFILGHEGAHSIEITGMPYFTDLNYLVETSYQQAVVQRDLWNHGGISYAGSNRAEYFATLTNIWHSTMRESTDGSNNGTWLPINTREELYAYDRWGYEMAKIIFYNDMPGVDIDQVNRSLASGLLHLSDTDGTPITRLPRDPYLPGFDKDGRSINDELIRWGSSFPARKMRQLDRKFSDSYSEDIYFRWVSWSCANQWDINDDHDPDSGIQYGKDSRARYSEVNYNPYLQK